MTNVSGTFLIMLEILMVDQCSFVLVKSTAHLTHDISMTQMFVLHVTYQLSFTDEFGIANVTYADDVLRVRNVVGKHSMIQQLFRC